MCKVFCRRWCGRLPSEHLQRERLELGDGDFLDLDWSRCAASTQPRPLVIISHGLEGHSRRPYVLGMARQANRQGFDALAWNFRACSGEPNRLPRMYHSGATEDLHAVVEHAVACGYQRIHLVGFSMGGNLSLVYAGRVTVPVCQRRCARWWRFLCPVISARQCVTAGQTP